MAEIEIWVTHRLFLFQRSSISFHVCVCLPQLCELPISHLALQATFVLAISLTVLGSGIGKSIWESSVLKQMTGGVASGLSLFCQAQLMMSSGCLKDAKNDTRWYKMYIKCDSHTVTKRYTMNPSSLSPSLSRAPYLSFTSDPQHFCYCNVS